MYQWTVCHLGVRRPMIRMIRCFHLSASMTLSLASIVAACASEGEALPAAPEEGSPEGGGLPGTEDA